MKDPATGHGLCLDKGGGGSEDHQDEGGDGGHVQHSALEGHHSWSVRDGTVIKAKTTFQINANKSRYLKKCVRTR